MPRKKTTQDFIDGARKVHGDKYDYSKSVYKGSDSKVCVICPKHGEFWPTANNHLRGSGCPQCVGRTVSTERFIEKAREVHGDKYDYSKVKYVNPSTPVTIICPEHGEFQQKPSLHLCGNGCKECSGNVRMTTERFIRKAQELYGDKYDYSKSRVVGNNKVKVCVFCRTHGEFWVSPNAHLRGIECPKCYGTPKKTTEQFIEEARKVHGDKYDYSKADYQGGRVKVCIICPVHGEFWQNPYTHIKGGQCPECSGTQRITEEVFLRRAPIIHENKYDYSKVYFSNVNDFVTIICPEHGEYEQRVKVHMRGYGCPYCGGSKRLTTEEFIEKATAVHDGKYDYSKSHYINTATKVCIICPDHGEFWQVPNNHLLGAGCPKCAGKYNDKEFFIERARKAHGDKYDYSKVEYVATNEKVCIICPEHGEFWQTPSGHMHGQGCPMCNQRHLERDVMRFLRSQKIKFVAQKTFDWLISSRALRLDFFLPDYGVAIECQGGQHFTAIDFFGGEEGFQNTTDRDLLKKQLCEEHGIRVLYYSDLQIIYPYFVIEDFETLLHAIKEKGFVSDRSKWEDPRLPLVFDS